MVEYRPSGREALNVRRTLDFQRELIDLLEGQLDELTRAVEASQPKEETLVADWIASTADVAAGLDGLQAQLLVYADDLRDLIEKTQTAEQQLAEISQEVVRVLINLVETKDPHTLGHAIRVARSAVAIGQRSGLGDEQRSIVFLGGLLHDAGNLAIDARILAKPGPLSRQELESVKQHPLLGAKILAGIKSLEKVVPVVLCHHERIDGRGYPQGLRGPRIPLEAKIVAVAEVFDGMVASRAYRSGLPVDEAIKRLRRAAGSQLEGEYVRAFIAAWKAGEIADYE